MTQPFVPPTNPPMPIRWLPGRMWPVLVLLLLCGMWCYDAACGQDISTTTTADEFWPSWRGPLATGEAPRARPPTRWSETEQVQWKVELPGLGHSTPIVWGQTVFVTTAIPVGEPLEPRYSQAPGAHDNAPVTSRQKFAVLAVNRRDGSIRWKTDLREALPQEAGHLTASLASNSPVTDGQHLYAFFGSHGLYCLDFEGRVVWQRSFGVMQSKHGHGEGSSPALYDDTLFVVWDHEGESFLIALDKLTGNERWKVARDEPTSWASPIVVRPEGQAQVIVSGTNRVRAYDATNGEVIWQTGGLSANVVASPVSSDGVAIFGSSYDTQAMFAVDLHEARGELTNSKKILWSRRQRTPYVPSPLLYRGSVYFLRHYQNVLSIVDAQTGAEPVGPFRLDGIGNLYASPVAADGRLYLTDLNGATLVLTADRIPRPLALNRLDDSFSASPAVAGQQMFLRGRRFLYCVADDSDRE